MRPNREWCAMTFISDRGYDVRPRGENSVQKKRIDLTLRKILPPRSSESGFHRNVKFATFEEAGRLCKTIPQDGVKVAPLGGRSIPKLPHWTFYGVGPSNHPEHPSNRLATTLETA